MKSNLPQTTHAWSAMDKERQCTKAQRVLLPLVDVSSACEKGQGLGLSEDVFVCFFNLTSFHPKVILDVHEMLSVSVSVSDIKKK